MNPSLEASWRHPWRQDLYTGATTGQLSGSGRAFEVPITRKSKFDPDSACR
ncbi:hypothetical protein [Halorhodospira halochloris]|uniref:hypothetical protein n=1 Tax=Halorhodospira halochloris TaxID=1052 RepID=UPI0013A55213|nr:hypothetical protein [Halorhodospira halochloris]